MIKRTWTSLKALKIAKSLPFQYTIDDQNFYTIMLIENGMEWYTRIPITTPKSADQIDFEDNYLSTANGAIINKNVISDGIDTVGIVSGRLQTESVPSSSTTTLPLLKNVQYDDMNVSNGGVARDTSITTTYSTIYNYSGTGALIGFIVTFEGNLLGADPFIIKLTIDSSIVFELNTLDVGTQSLYNFDESEDSQILGIRVHENTFVFKSPMNSSIKYNSSINVQIKKASGGSKRFRAGLMVLTKE